MDNPPVPIDPAELVLRTGMVHRHKLEIVRGRLAQPPRPRPVPAAPAADGVTELLEVFLWGRVGAGPLERSGDPPVAPRVRELAAAATQ